MDVGLVISNAGFGLRRAPHEAHDAATLTAGPYSAAYSASKAMVTALGEALWGELADTEIDVLTLCPGKTVSEAAVKQGFDPSMLEWPRGTLAK
jgi:short-subunit dehydrogenase